MPLKSHSSPSSLLGDTSAATSLFCPQASSGWNQPQDKLESHSDYSKYEWHQCSLFIFWKYLHFKMVSKALDWNASSFWNGVFGAAPEHLEKKVHERKGVISFWKFTTHLVSFQSPSDLGFQRDISFHTDVSISAFQTRSNWMWCKEYKLFHVMPGFFMASRRPSLGTVSTIFYLVIWLRGNTASSSVNWRWITPTPGLVLSIGWDDVHTGERERRGGYMMAATWS